MTELANVYYSAKQYLENYLDTVGQPQSGHDLLAREVSSYREPTTVQSLEGVYAHALDSLRNQQGWPNFIGKGDKFKKVLGGILFNYDPHKVYERYGDDFEGLLSTFQGHFSGKKFDITNKRNVWNKFTRGVISAAKFISTFKSYREFDDFVHSFAFNEYTVAALPMLLQHEIFGFGFPLACDFLKESGYTSYGKPDVHLKDIFIGVGIVDNDSDFETFKTIVKMAREVDEPAVIVDKLFWIIGSGAFNVGGFTIPRQKSHFIDYYKELNNGHSQ